MEAPTLRAAAPPPVENRRLKLLGLVLLACAATGFAWLSAFPMTAWPPSGADLWRYGLVGLLGANVAAAGLLLLAAGFGRARWQHDPRARRAAGLKLLGANIVMPALVYALITDDQALADRLSQSGWDEPVSALVGVLLVCAYAFLRRSWRTEALSADEAMAHDPRPPVLYLRSFRDDEAVALDEASFPLIRRLLRSVVLATPEQELSWLLNRVGPVVAIGKPGEPLPELGAARLYVSHADWQNVVSTLMRRAALVVVRVGASPGVLWEIEQALAHLPRQRLLFVVLGEGPLAEPIALQLAPVLGDAVHAAAPPRRNRLKALFWSDPRRRLGTLICFGPDGTPRVEPVRIWPIVWRDVLVTLLMRPSAGPLRGAFRRIFEHLRLPWEQGSQRYTRAVAIALALTVGGFGAHWFYLGHRRRAWAYMAFFVLAVPIFLAWADALRMILMERAVFDVRYGAKGVGAP